MKLLISEKQNSSFVFELNRAQFDLIESASSFFLTFVFETEAGAPGAECTAC